MAENESSNESSVGTISLDLVVNTQMGEQLGRAKKSIKRKITAPFQNAETQISEFSETMREKLGLVFEVPSNPAEKLRHEVANTYNKLELLQKKWQELMNAEPSDKINSQLNATERQIMSTEQQLAKLEARFNEMNQTNHLNSALRFEVPKNPLKQLKIELDTTKQKLEILQQKWRELSSAEPTEQVRSQLVQVEQQIISTQRTIDGLNQKIRESGVLILSFRENVNEVLSLISAPFRGIGNTILAPFKAMSLT